VALGLLGHRIGAHCLADRGAIRSSGLRVTKGGKMRVNERCELEITHLEKLLARDTSAYGETNTTLLASRLDPGGKIAPVAVAIDQEQPPPAADSDYDAAGIVRKKTHTCDVEKIVVLENTLGIRVTLNQRVRVNHKLGCNALSGAALTLFDVM